MNKQIAIIGLGRFGTTLATTLNQRGREVLAIDKSAEAVDSIAPHVSHAIRADATAEGVLQKMGVGSFDMAVVAIGADIQGSVLITILLKNLGVRFVVARADNELHGSILEKIGADKVVYPERDTAIRIAPVLSLKDVTDYLPISNGAGLLRIDAPPYFIGKTLADIGFGPAGKKEVVVLMIQRGKEAILNPSVEEVVSHIDILLVTGNDSDVEKLFSEAERAAEREAPKAKHNGD